jgi:flagellum-specific ATP synthase
MPQSDVEGIVPAPASIRSNRSALPRTGPISFTPRRADEHSRLPVGDELLGRVLDGAGRPLDNLGPLHTERSAPAGRARRQPAGPRAHRDILDTGVRAINTMLTVGRGQRMGLFAGSGVGKSVLLGMMARYTSADVIVVGLIGERGREVKEFIEQILGAEGLARSVVVAAPADTPPLMRLQARPMHLDCRVFPRPGPERAADHGFADPLRHGPARNRAGHRRTAGQGLSAVRVRQAALVERAGNGDEGGGSITAFYTVLTEGDDQQDPIADCRPRHPGRPHRAQPPAGRSRPLPGHRYRTIHQPCHAQHHGCRPPTPFAPPKQLYSRFQRNRDLISVGAYAAGSDPVLDEAIALLPRMESFLQQGIHEQADVSESLRQLTALFG